MSMTAQTLPTSKTSGSAAAPGLVKHGGFDIALLSLADMQRDVAAWQDLSTRAAEDNVYYAPQYALALLGSVSEHDDVVFVTARDGQRLMALLPVLRPHRALPGLLAAGRAWTSDYTFSANPLLDAAAASSAADALVEGLALLKLSLWTIPTVNIDGPAARAFIAALERRSIPWLSRAGFGRASLDSSLSFDAWMEDVVGSKRRRELVRNRRRLEEQGTVTHEVHTSGEGLRRGVEAFLALELSGWKGKRGTALACSDDSRRFALDAFASGSPTARTRVDLLLLEGKPIAAGVIVFAGETGFTVKGAYDEDYARYSAGLLLEVEVLKSFLTEKWAKRLDAATAGEHVIDRFWPDRVQMADLVFSMAQTGAAAQLALHCRIVEVHARLKATAKRLLRR
jgi:CelD/BcsL family acetyltransferase involved in cellulose biosynthesis